MSTFAELERRIANLPDEKSRGDTFEVFEETYLATQRIHQVREIWPKDKMPPSLQQRLRLPLKDIMAERTKRLEEIGFVWSLVESNPWETTFERLVEFKKVHGNCNVPQKTKEYKRLGKWVNTQRTTKTRGKMLPNRKQRLDSIGFIWNLRPYFAPAR